MNKIFITLIFSFVCMFANATSQYALSPDDLKLFGPNNPYGFTYELLINKLIEQYFKTMKTH